MARRPSESALRAMLTEGHFVAPAEQEVVIPADAMPMLVDIADIRPYDRNPRRAPNPLAAEVKASIRALGLLQPLVITRRPHETDGYMVKAGGNTRLAALRALFAETGDPRFGRVQCLFVPWVSESLVLASHLAENDVRGELTLIDRARAIRDARELLEAELGRRLSRRALAGALAERGYRLDHTQLPRLEYAVDVLLPRIPQALEAGLGKATVQHIRLLERAARGLWMRRRLGTSAAFAETFGALLARTDGPDWVPERLRRALEVEIAEQAEETVHWASLSLDALLAGREPPTRDALDAIASAEGWPAPGPPRRRRKEKATDDIGGWDGTDGPSTETDDETTVAPLSFESLDEASLTTPPEALTRTLRAARTRDGDVLGLRARAWVLAGRIARAVGLGEIVAPLPERGCGFLVDVPVNATRSARVVWWLLATVSEQHAAPAAQVAESLPDTWQDSVLAAVLRQADAPARARALAAHVPLDIGPALGPLALRPLDEATWTDLVHLLDCYRRLRQAFRGRSPWEPVG